VITEDGIATATIAQIFGSELLQIQSKAQTDAGTTPQLVTMDPKQFLFTGGQNNPLNQQRQLQEQRLLQSLQREAEAAYPIQQPEPLPLPPQHSLSEQTTVVPIVAAPQPRRLSSDVPAFSLPQNVKLDVWERIAMSLETIAYSLQNNKVSKITPNKRKKINNSK
jgi:hypothetical protein